MSSKKQIPKYIIERLKFGREFQFEVYKHLSEETKTGIIQREIETKYEGEKQRKKGTYGRMDIFMEERKDGFIVIYEIKATNWDAIKVEHIQRNLDNHGRQLHRYIEKHVNEFNDTVIFGVIYPKPPKKDKLRVQIEEMAIDHNRNYPFPVYWFSEIKESV